MPVASPVVVAPLDSLDALERPLARLRLALVEAEREFQALRRAYSWAAEAARALPAADGAIGQGQRLSPQEARVAYLLAQGRSNNEIAAGLHVSVHTVKSQVQSILRKRGLRSRWQLVAASVTEGNPAARPERSLLGG